jgi:hypothetical protein
MPLLVDEHGELISGHARVGAAIILELKSIPVIVARGWSEDEKRAYRVADNQLAAGDLGLRSVTRRTMGARVRRLRSPPDRLRSARNHPGRCGGERSDGSGQRPRSPRSTGHPARRQMAVGKAPGWLRQQHQ